AIILLDLATRGILTAAYIYEPGPYLPVLVAFVTTAIWLLPQLCSVDGETRAGALLPKIVLIVGVITGMKLLMHAVDLGLVTFMRLTDTNGWGKALDLWVYVMLGVGGERPLPRLMDTEVSWAKFAEMHVLRPMAYFGLALPPVLVAFLWADAMLKRRTLMWYGFGSRVRRVFGLSTIVCALLLDLAAIPLLNHLLFPEIYAGWSVATVAGAVGAVAIAFGCGIWFWHLDRRWAGRCPACHQPVSGYYYPGKACPNEMCNQPLHPWLVAAY
ncbi:MAG: hypothetical protein ACP5UQ_16530, partial [Anaerolineae bacterium]